MQDLNTAMGTFMRLAGGKPGNDETSLEEFMHQAEEYETVDGAELAMEPAL